MIRKIKLVLPALLFALSGCDNPFAYQKDTHSRGKEKIYLEDSYRPLFETAIATYEGQKPLADLVPVYCTEQEAITALYSNKTNTICITREFTPEELNDLKKANIEIRTSPVVLDAVALIVNPGSKDTSFTVDEIKAIMKGQMNKWPTSRKDINVVFDNTHSANFFYILNLIQSKQLPSNVFALKSNLEVLDYVREHENAIGVIGINYLSDEDDPVVQERRKQVRMLAIAKVPGKEYFEPYQGYISTRDYPFTRMAYLINKGSRSGLNTGFVNWMEKENGQLLVSKCGLVPARMQKREFQIVEE